jgi:hypothetical protein
MLPVPGAALSLLDNLLPAVKSLAYLVVLAVASGSQSMNFWRNPPMVE